MNVVCCVNDVSNKCLSFRRIAAITIIIKTQFSEKKASVSNLSRERIVNGFLDQEEGPEPFCDYSECRPPTYPSRTL